MIEFENNKFFAEGLDVVDKLKHFRDQFYIPVLNGKEAIYFTGNSLGLQPKSAQEYVLDEMEDWASFGVEGHFHARNPWKNYHEMFPQQLSKIVGALPHEIVVMNSLSVNLHLMMATFYRPTKERFKIICEAKAFPSDQYAFESAVKLAGFDPAETIIEVMPRPGEVVIRTEDILKIIEEEKDTVALVFFSGINYYTGQVFDMKKITDATHEAGAYCGFDLAHAAGNIELNLHEWEIDFACWCTYKYLNSGPGAVGGVFIHEKHATNTSLPRMAGWWGQEKETRFKMEKEFKPIPTAEGWQLSNGPILSMAVHKASLDIFEAAEINKLIFKAELLFQFLCFIIDDINTDVGIEKIKILTPREPGTHGCQVSMVITENGKKVFDQLKSNGVIADWREPDVIRIAPVPLYNNFMDVFKFGEILKEAVGAS